MNSSANRRTCDSILDPAATISRRGARSGGSGDRARAENANEVIGRDLLAIKRPVPGGTGLQGRHRSWNQCAEEQILMRWWKCRRALGFKSRGESAENGQL